MQQKLGHSKSDIGDGRIPTLRPTSPLRGGGRAQRSEHVGWGPHPKSLTRFRPPRKGEVELSPLLASDKTTVRGRKSPCSTLFFDMRIWPLVEETPAVRRFPARVHALKKRVALLFAL